MKTLNPHPHVIKLLGCITESGKLSKMYWLALHFTGLYLHYDIKSGSTVSVFDKFFLLNSAMVLVFLSPTQINTDSFLHVLNHILYEIWTFQAIPFGLYITSLWERNTYFILLRTHVGIDRVCAIWRSPWLPEKEPWTQWHLLQRSRHQTTNKSDATAADEICLANSWWNELLVKEICKLDSLIIAIV